jgi:hypothetical protein
MFFSVTPNRPKYEQRARGPNDHKPAHIYRMVTAEKLGDILKDNWQGRTKLVPPLMTEGIWFEKGLTNKKELILHTSDFSRLFKAYADACGEATEISIEMMAAAIGELDQEGRRILTEKARDILLLKQAIARVPRLPSTSSGGPSQPQKMSTPKRSSKSDPNRTLPPPKDSSEADDSDSTMTGPPTPRCKKRMRKNPNPRKIERKY